jgi:hypothetical protein
MSGNKIIALSWLTFVTLLLAAGAWSFSNMGDCLPDVSCYRAGWIDPLILAACAAFWFTSARFTIRRKKKA